MQFHEEYCLLNLASYSQYQERSMCTEKRLFWNKIMKKSPHDNVLMCTHGYQINPFHDISICPFYGHYHASLSRTLGSSLK